MFETQPSKNSIRIVHFADIHFGMENYGKIDPVTGLNSRLLDFQKAYQKIIDHAIKNQVDAVLFAGDAYKTREPTPTHQRLFAQGIQQIASADIPMVMIVGNHDLPGAIGKSHSLDIFHTLKIPNVTVVSKPDIINLGVKHGILQIACLPWLTRSEFLTSHDTKKLTQTELNHSITNQIAEKITNFNKRVDDSGPAILMAHGTVEGAQFGSERIVELGTDIIIPLDAIKRSQFNYVALGHIHQRQEIINQPMVVYPGSIERIDFGEAKEPKGFMDVTFIKDHQWELAKADFVSTEARTFRTIPVPIAENDPDPTQTVIAKINESHINQTVVKVVIHCDEIKAGEIREGPIREALQGAFYIAAITKQIDDHGRMKTKDGYSDELVALQPIELLEKYLKARQKSASNIEALKQYAQLLLEESTIA